MKDFNGPHPCKKHSIIGTLSPSKKDNLVISIFTSTVKSPAILGCNGAHYVKRIRWFAVARFDERQAQSFPLWGAQSLSGGHR
jgi:hypothetical protein